MCFIMTKQTNKPGLGKRYAPFCSVVTDTYHSINNDDSLFLTPCLGRVGKRELIFLQSILLIILYLLFEDGFVFCENCLG